MITMNQPQDNMTLIEYQLAMIGGRAEILATWRDSDGDLLAYHNISNGKCNMVMASYETEVPDLPQSVLDALQRDYDETVEILWPRWAASNMEAT